MRRAQPWFASAANSLSARLSQLPFFGVSGSSKRWANGNALAGGHTGEKEPGDCGLRGSWPGLTH
jgi:hypothetical protein